MGDAAVVTVPELVPASMVSAFSYCPRLFYLEWVDGRREVSVDLEEGRFVHRAVDRKVGAMPGPEEPDAVLRRARSVELSSPRLGLIGRADVLEGVDGSVRVVEVKKGRPHPSNGAWDADQLQVGVLALLLREEGYRCDEAVVFYAATRQRLSVPIDDALIARVLQHVLDLREVAAAAQPPAPLVDSPKCPRCSLVGFCLPDELNSLSERSNKAPRRLLPRLSEARPLYVTVQGATVGTRAGRIEVNAPGAAKLASVRTIDVSQICLYGNVTVSSQAIRACFREEIPLCWFSYGGWFQGIAEGLPGKNVELRRQQVLGAQRHSLALSRAVVAGKIRNGRTLLMRNGQPRPSAAIDALAGLRERALLAPSLPSLLGVEGAAARTYFESLPTMLRSSHSLPGGAFTFEGRNRRPPKDAINCLLSYSYSLLIKDLTATLVGLGFDPYQGFYHQPRFGRPALALDLAEEFRPIIGDSVAIGVVNNGEVTPKDFTVRAGGVALSEDGRRAVLGAYERRLDTEVTHPEFGYKVTYRRVLEVQGRLLAALLLGEIDTYPPFRTR